MIEVGSTVVNKNSKCTRVYRVLENNTKKNIYELVKLYDKEGDFIIYLPEINLEKRDETSR